MARAARGGRAGKKAGALWCCHQGRGDGVTSAAAEDCRSRCTPSIAMVAFQFQNTAGKPSGDGSIRHKCSFRCCNHVMGNLYRCSLTGSLHVCDWTCTERIPYDNISTICLITKKVLPNGPGTQEKLDAISTGALQHTRGFGGGCPEAAAAMDVCPRMPTALAKRRVRTEDEGGYGSMTNDENVAEGGGLGRGLEWEGGRAAKIMPR